MTDVTSRLRLVVDSSGVDRAGRRIKGLRKDARGLEAVVKRLSQAFAGLGAAVGAGFLGAAAFRETARFTEQISAVGAVSKASSAELEAFSARARELGASTAFSASQAAEGMQFLAMAGFDAQQTVDAIGPSLNLAAAGALDLGRAADISSNILSSFRLETEELTRVVDVLAQASSSSNTSVEQLGQGFKFVGAIAKSTGVSVEETAAGLSVLSNAGLQAELAGTGLRKVITKLAAPTDELSAKMGGLTIEVDGLQAVIEQIAQSGLSTAEAIEEFGDRGGPAILNLVAAFEDLERFKGENFNAIGRAADIAARRLDNLAGDVKILQSVYSEFLLSIGDGQANEAARGLVQSLTDAFNSDEFAQLSEGISSGIAGALNAISAAVPVITSLVGELGNLAKALGLVAAAFVAIKVGIFAAGIAKAVAFTVALSTVLPTGVVALAAYGTAVKAVTAGFAAMRTAALAFIATPIGAALTAAGAAYLLFSEQSRQAAREIEKSTVALRAAFSDMGIAEEIKEERIRTIAEMDEFQNQVKARTQEIARDLARQRAAANPGPNLQGGNNFALGRSFGPTREERAQANKQALQEKTATYAELSKTVDKFYAGIGKLAKDTLAAHNKEKKALEDVTVATADAAAEAKVYEVANARLAVSVGNVAKALTQQAVEAARTAEEYQRAYEAAQQDQEDQRFLIERARLGEQEQRVAEEVLRLRREIKGISVEAAEELARQNVELEEQLGIISQQREEYKSLFDGLGQNAGDLWRAFVAEGTEAVDALRSVMSRLFGDFAPLFKALTNEGGFSFNPGQVFDNLQRAIDNLTDSLTSLASRIPGIGAGGAGLLGTLGASLFGGIGGLAIGQGLLGPLGIQGNPQSTLGGGIAGAGLGLGAGALLGSGALVTGTGGLLGAAGLAGTLATAGSVVPIVGTAIGAILGTVLGGLSSKPSNNFGAVDLNSEGDIIARFAKDKGRGDANLERAVTFADNFAVLLGELESLTGGTLTNIAEAISFDDRTGGLSIQINGVWERFGQDVEAGLERVLDLAIGSITGVPDELKQGIAALASQDLGTEELFAELEKMVALNDRLQQSTDPLVFGIEQLAGQFDGLVDTAEKLGVSVGPGSDFASLVEQDIAAFFDQMIANGSTVQDLRERFTELAMELEEVGIASEVTAAALEKVAQGQAKAFDDRIQDEISQFLTGPTDRLNALFKEIEALRKEAIAQGGDLAEVNRLANLKLTDFFQSLSDQALSEVEDFLGLFDEATSSVVRNLDLSRQDLRAQADSFGEFAQDFAGLNAQFTEQFIAQSQRESIGVLQERASSLLGDVRGGDAAAAGELPDVLNDLVNNAFATFGNTTQFKEVLAFAQGILTEAEAAAIDIQTDAERQIAALDENNDILADIRDILSSGEAVNAFFQSAANGGIASADDLLSIIQSGVGVAGVANDNASALSITNLIGQTLQPIIVPLTDSIDNFTQRLSDLPALQAQTIDAVDRASDRIVGALEDIDDRLSAMERLDRKQLEELEELNADAA